MKSKVSAVGSKASLPSHRPPTSSAAYIDRSKNGIKPMNSKIQSKVKKTSISSACDNYASNSNFMSISTTNQQENITNI